MEKGLIFVAVLVSFRYYNELCFITVKDSKGVAHNVLLGSSATYKFGDMMQLRKQAVKCTVEFNGRDDADKYDKYIFRGFDLE